jgi:hypothetical protein
LNIESLIYEILSPVNLISLSHDFFGENRKQKFIGERSRGRTLRCRIHDTLLLYNELLAGFNRYRDYYYNKTIANANGIEIRITRKDRSTQLKMLGARIGFKAWAWRENLDAADFR